MPQRRQEVVLKWGMGYTALTMQQVDEVVSVRAISRTQTVLLLTRELEYMYISTLQFLDILCAF
jgi:hypothetical protein